MREIIYYEANDGTRFDEEFDCMQYEKHLGLCDLNMEIMFTDELGNKLKHPVDDFDQVYGIQITFSPEEMNCRTLYETFVKIIQDDIDDLPCWDEIILQNDNSIRIFFNDLFDEWICLDYYINYLTTESNEIFRELNEQNAY